MKATEPKTADQVVSQPHDSGWKCSSSTPFSPKQLREPGPQPQTFAVMVKVPLFTHQADAKPRRSAQEGIRVELLGGAVSGDGLARQRLTLCQHSRCPAASQRRSAPSVYRSCSESNTVSTPHMGGAQRPVGRSGPPCPLRTRTSPPSMCVCVCKTRLAREKKTSCYISLHGRNVIQGPNLCVFSFSLQIWIAVRSLHELSFGGGVLPTHRPTNF